MPKKSTAMPVIESTDSTTACSNNKSCAGTCKTPCLSKRPKVEAITRAVIEQPVKPLRIKHIRPAIVIDDEAELRSHNGGLTVAYRESFSGQDIEVATAVCSRTDGYNRKLGATLATERFNAGARIMLPTLGMGGDAAIERLLRNYFTAYISSEDLNG